MAYVDPQFNVTVTKLLTPITGTATASATNGVNVSVPAFSNLQAVDISKVRVVVSVVPKTGSMGLVVNLLAGTATVATATMGTKTASGDILDATLTTNTRVAADSLFNAVVTGTATASGDTIGTMLVEVAEKPVFV